MPPYCLGIPVCWKDNGRVEFRPVFLSGVAIREQRGLPSLSKGGSKSDRDDVFLNRPKPCSLLSVEGYHRRVLAVLVADEAVKLNAERGHAHLASGHPQQ